ncbi:medium-chain acyl-CoA ligase ACSF2, mitochondrial-like [Amphiura filiformis]|uniref:medium-chain acyl-CoA ligase ACSF2, mitochondrial-like n=1 Tax=Amphiura filiformis TaxID=82378 RepID=UPI003B210151
MADTTLTRSYIHVPRKIPFTCLTIGQQFYETVKRIPDKEMFVFFEDDESITFQQMKDQSQQFAASLLSLGMKKGDRMAFWGANHAEWLIGLYACTQLGIIAVTFCLDLPVQTLDILLKKLQCKCLLLTRSPDDLVDRTVQLIPELRDHSTKGFPSFPDLELIVHGNLSHFDHHQESRVYNMDAFMKLATQSDMDQVETICWSIDMDDPWNHGSPKPSVLSHHAVVNCAADTGAYRQGVDGFNDNWDSVRFGATMDFACSTSFSPTFLPIIRGCTTIVLFRVFDAEIMAKAFQQERVTECISFINQITALLSLPNIEGYDFSSLRIVCMSGSTMPVSLLQKASKIIKNITNMFGMTETLDNIANHPLDPQDELDDNALFPYGGMECKIVNDEGTIVPINTQGELHMRGYPLFMYYWGEEEKTKAMKDSNGWLHTGDIAEMDHRGFIRIRGRIKELIIKSAANLAPAELESVLSRHPSIISVLVVGVPDYNTGEEVCACVSVRKENGKNTVTKDELIEFCRGKVHAQLVPKYVVFVDRFPTTDSGKFSRKEMTKRVIEMLHLTK